MLHLLWRNGRISACMNCMLEISCRQGAGLESGVEDSLKTGMGKLEQKDASEFCLLWDNGRILVSMSCMLEISGRQGGGGG